MTNTDKLVDLLRECELFLRVLGIDSKPAANLAADCRAALAAHEAAARATAPETGDTNGRHDGLRPDLHGRVPLGGHTPGALADLLWASDDVVALNAELGLTMDRLVQFAQAVLAAAKAEPAGEAVPVGQAAPIPGTSGFTMAAFKAADVPVGTNLYTRPPAAPAAEPLTKSEIYAVFKKAWGSDNWVEASVLGAQSACAEKWGVKLASGGEVQHG